MALIVGSHATSGYESGQVRKEAAISSMVRVLWECLAGANDSKAPVGSSFDGGVHGNSTERIELLWV